MLRGGGSAGESVSGEIPCLVIVGGGGNACRGDRCRAERAVPRTVDAVRLWRRGVHDAFLGNLYLEGDPVSNGFRRGCDLQLRLSMLCCLVETLREVL